MRRSLADAEQAMVAKDREIERLEKAFRWREKIFESAGMTYKKGSGWKATCHALLSAQGHPHIDASSA
jgi:hypothetical protein